MMFAAGAEIPYVMAQVGHEDSKVTLQIYARVLKRRDRDEIGQAFDHLLLGRAEGREQHLDRAGEHAAGTLATGPEIPLNPG
jgi:hypothetical protein